MKHWNIIFAIVMAILFAGFVSVYGQDTTSRSQVDSLEIIIKDNEKTMEEMAKNLEILIKRTAEKATKEYGKEIARELGKVLEELQKEIKELGEELGEEDQDGNPKAKEQKSGQVKTERNKEKSEGEEELDDHDGHWSEILDGLDIKFNKKKSKLKDVKTRWFLVDLGFASYIAPDALPEINGINPMEPDLINSISWRLHIFNQRINIANHYLNLVYGAGFSYNFYGFSNPSTLVAASPQVNFTLPDGNEISYKKNHLRATYLHIPLMLNLETNPYQKSKSFHINAGVYGNVLLGAKTSQKTNNRKIKMKDKFNLENFQYGLLAQLGYGPVTFYGTYGLNELFKPEKDNGYKVNPITFGVKLLPF